MYKSKYVDFTKMLLKRLGVVDDRLRRVEETVENTDENRSASSAKE